MKQLKVRVSNDKYSVNEKRNDPGPFRDPFLYPESQSLYLTSISPTREIHRKLGCLTLIYCFPAVKVDLPSGHQGCSGKNVLHASLGRKLLLELCVLSGS